PLSRRWSTWSFMREMSGLTTTVIPSKASAVSWKQRLFPEPVGMTTSVSRPPRAESTASAWPGRNLRKPKYSRMRSPSGGSGGGGALATFGVLAAFGFAAFGDLGFAFGFASDFGFGVNFVDFGFMHSSVVVRHASTP